MTLAEGFTPVQHFKSVLLKIYNKMVKEEFEDLDPDDLDITTPRNSLKTACLISPEDSQILINNRMMLFYFLLRKAQDLQPSIAGIPLEDYAQKVTFRPQITLFFKEKEGSVEEGYSPLRSQVSIRIPNKTHETISKSELISYGNKIKFSFGGATPYYFKRGKVCVHYHDKAEGFRFLLFVFSKSEGKDVINKVLDLVGKTPNWEYLSSSENDDPVSAYPIIPPTKIIAGETRKMPRKRPVGNVYFQYATAEVYGVPRPIVLYAISTLFKHALVY